MLRAELCYAIEIERYALHKRELRCRHDDARYAGGS